jgi:hypothetical protein
LTLFVDQKRKKEKTQEKTLRWTNKKRLHKEEKERSQRSAAVPHNHIVAGEKREREGERRKG